jgi:hypothetical protein
VREREPHGADLLPAGRDAVEDSARDDEVGARVVVAEREIRARVVYRGGNPGGERERGSDDWSVRAQRLEPERTRAIRRGKARGDQVF